LKHVHFRVDDRLIHGQVVTVWSRYYKLKQIIIVDDEVARDPIQRQIISVVTPADMKVHICGTGDAPPLIEQAESEGISTMVLVKGPEALAKLAEHQVPVREVIMGGMQFKAGHRQITKTVSVSERQAVLFAELSKAGIKFTLQVIPSERPQDFIEILQSKGG